MTTKRFPGNFRSLAPIGDFITRQAQGAGFAPNDVYAIQMAVDEACSNIIDHAYQGEDRGQISITVNKFDDRLEIVLRDHGDPFNPAIIPEPDIRSPLELRKERGLGIYFIQNLMDEVAFKFSPARGNTLTLVKYKGGAT